MLFLGELELPDDAGTSLEVQMKLADGLVSLSTGSETLGEWARQEAAVVALGRGAFDLTLGSETLVFRAANPAAFSAKAIPFIDDAEQPASDGFLGRFRNKKKSVEPKRAPEETPPEPDQPQWTEPPLTTTPSTATATAGSMATEPMSTALDTRDFRPSAEPAPFKTVEPSPSNDSGEGPLGRIAEPAASSPLPSVSPATAEAFAEAPPLGRSASPPPKDPDPAPPADPTPDPTAVVAAVRPPEPKPIVIESTPPSPQPPTTVIEPVETFVADTDEIAGIATEIPAPADPSIIGGHGPVLPDLPGLLARLETSIDDLRAGRMEPARGRAIADVVRAMCRAVEVSGPPAKGLAAIADTLDTESFGLGAPFEDEDK